MRQDGWNVAGQFRRRGMWRGVATQVRTHRTHGTQKIHHLRQDATPTDQTQGPFLLMLMDEITSNAVTRSQKRKASASSPATSSAASNDSRISIENSWGDNRTLPISSEMERRHSEMSWMSCTDDACEIHKNEKEGAGYWPRDPKVRKQTKKTKRKEQDRTST